MKTAGDVASPGPSPLQRLALSPTFAPVRAGILKPLRATYGRKRPLLATRGELPILLNQRGLVHRGFELGVKEGDFSEAVLRLWNGRQLVSVDPWLADPSGDYLDLANVDQAAHDRFYSTTCARLAPFGDRSEIWRMTSSEAAERVPAHSLDFVYLDARHDYDSVLEDLGAWIDKLRPGGIMAGHDYVDGQFSEGVFGVKSAVDEFFRARGMTVTVTLNDAPWKSWMVILPRS